MAKFFVYRTTVECFDVEAETAGEAIDRVENGLPPLEPVQTTVKEIEAEPHG